jgi:hypothetical protein
VAEGPGEGSRRGNDASTTHHQAPEGVRGREEEINDKGEGQKMYMFVEEAISDAFKVFLVGMILYSVFFLILLRLTLYRTQSFARKNLRSLQKLKEFMEKKETGGNEEGSKEGHELLNNIIARYRAQA